MDKDLLAGNLGDIGKYDLAIKEGKLVVELDANMPIGSAGLVVKIDAVKVIEAIEAAIPGQIDNLVLDQLKALLKA